MKGAPTSATWPMYAWPCHPQARSTNEDTSSTAEGTGSGALTRLSALRDWGIASPRPT
jgi:hypothetical protein